MEISWYLRFHRENSIIFLVGPDAAGQVEHALYIETGWQLDLSPFSEDGKAGLQATVTRKVPRQFQEQA